MYHPDELIIHIDGSAYKNPGHESGLAGIAEYPERLNREPEIIFKIGYFKTTNNRMELLACIKALEWIKKYTKNLGLPNVIILTDSQYVYDNQVRAMYWKKAKWRNREGRPIENHDLWDKLLVARKKCEVRIEIRWERGKSGELSKRVDKQAKEAAHELIKQRDYGYNPGKIARTKVTDGSSSMFFAKGQDASIRVYRKALKDRSGKQEYKIIFDLFSDYEQKFISKEFAYASPEVEQELHRNHSYLVKFSDNPKYPLIKEVIREINC